MTSTPTAKPEPPVFDSAGGNYYQIATADPASSGPLPMEELIRMGLEENERLRMAVFTLRHALVGITQRKGMTNAERDALKATEWVVTRQTSPL